MMAIEEEQYASEADEGMVQSGGAPLSPYDSTTDPSNPLTYDPTQGRGTDAWQATLRRQAEHNAKLGLETNARFRRN